MKTLVALFALALVACVTEPKTVTRDHDFDCVYMQEADSTVTPICNVERAK